MHRLIAALVILSVAVAAPAAHADIFQWEYINPADPSQGKRQSTMLCPDGAGAYAGLGANLSNRNLTTAYLIGADLSPLYIHLVQSLHTSNLKGTNLAYADLTDANFDGAYLTNADLTGAEIRGASFNVLHDEEFYGVFQIYPGRGTGITLAQLYSTASYQAHNLSGIGLALNNLSGANFSGQNLTDAVLDLADLGGADFTNAEVRGARFTRGSIGPAISRHTEGGITLAQLYSTASYAAHDLSGTGLAGNDLSGANFAGFNLTGANLSDANLTNADFTNAEVRGASLSSIALAQLYSTASYAAHNLSGIAFIGDLSGANLSGFNLTGATLHNLTGANLSGANLTNANLTVAVVTGADFSNAEVRGASFHCCGAGISLAQLYSTASYQAHDLSGITLWVHNLAGANFAGQNLSGANLSSANLTGADFTNAEVLGAAFDGSGFTLAQLYSTASYAAHDLSRIRLAVHNLSGANLSGQILTDAYLGSANLTGADFTNANLTGAYLTYANLTSADFHEANLANAYFYGATFTGTDFSAADARGAYGLDESNLTGASTANLIWPEGHIDGLELDAGALLVVRDHDFIPITVDQHLAMGPGGTLRMVFEADAWDSTIFFAPGIPVTLGGTLELTFAADVNLASQLGRTFDVFNWIGVNPTGAFAVSSPYAWDLSNLYTTGQVTLTATPEPSTVALAALCLFGAAVRLRRPLPHNSIPKSNEESHAEAQRRAGSNVERSSLRPQRLCVSLFLIVVFASAARADIFQWEYINPADPSQGKRQSTTLAPDGAGVDAVPGAQL